MPSMQYPEPIAKWAQEKSGLSNPASWLRDQLWLLHIADITSDGSRDSFTNADVVLLEWLLAEANWKLHQLNLILGTMGHEIHGTLLFHLERADKVVKGAN
jgi:hypothetical protein